MAISSRWRNPRRPRGLQRPAMFTAPPWASLSPIWNRRSSFYHGLLGFNLTGKMEFSSDPPIVDLIGAPHAKFRELTATVPGTKALMAFYEYQGIPRTPFHLRVTD